MCHFYSFTWWIGWWENCIKNSMVKCNKENIHANVRVRKQNLMTIKNLVLLFILCECAHRLLFAKTLQFVPLKSLFFSYFIFFPFICVSFSSSIFVWISCKNCWFVLFLLCFVGLLFCSFSPIRSVFIPFNLYICFRCYPPSYFMNT